MKKEFDVDADLMSIFKEVGRVIPEISCKTKISKNGVVVLLSPLEFYKKCIGAVSNSLQDIRETLDCFPDNPFVDDLEDSFSKIKNLLLAMVLSKKDLFQKL